MAITKLSITGNTTSVGISSTPIVISLAHKANATSVTPDGNITTTNVQAALEQLDDIKAQKTNGTLNSPTISGNASVSGTLTAAAINVGDTDLSDFKIGTWTPTNGDITFTVDQAKYIRIGSFVTLSMILSDVDTTGITDTLSSFKFGGIPYTPTHNTQGSTAFVDIIQHTGDDEIYCSVNTSSELRFQIGVDYENITYADLQSGDNGVINLQISYFI